MWPPGSSRRLSTAPSGSRSEARRAGRNEAESARPGGRRGIRSPTSGRPKARPRHQAKRRGRRCSGDPGPVGRPHPPQRIGCAEAPPRLGIHFVGGSRGGEVQKGRGRRGGGRPRVIGRGERRPGRGEPAKQGVAAGPDVRGLHAQAAEFLTERPSMMPEPAHVYERPARRREAGDTLRRRRSSGAFPDASRESAEP